MNKFFIIIILGSIALYGCSIPRRIKNEFLYSKEVYIDTILKNRVYTYLDSSVRDSFYISYILLKDGTLLTGFGGYIPNKMISEIKLVNSDKNISVEKSIYNSYYKGHYTIVEDTIIAKFINSPTTPKTWFAYEEKFLIIDDCLIRQIYSKQLIVDELPVFKQVDLVCLSVNVIDEFDIWLKYKKWYWSDEMKYKKWKKLHSKK